MNERTKSLETVRAWMNRDGRHPSLDEVWNALKELACEWKKEKSDGLDIVASVVADEIVEILKAYE